MSKHFAYARVYNKNVLSGDLVKNTDKMPRIYKRRKTGRRVIRRRRRPTYRSLRTAYGRGKSVRGMPTFQKELNIARNLGRTGFVQNGNYIEVVPSRVRGVAPPEPGYLNRLWNSGVAWGPENESAWDTFYGGMEAAARNPIVQAGLSLMGGQVMKDIAKNPKSLPGYEYLKKFKNWGGQRLNKGLGLFTSPVTKKEKTNFLSNIWNKISPEKESKAIVTTMGPQYFDPNSEETLHRLTAARNWAKFHNMERGYPDKDAEILELLEEMRDQNNLGNLEEEDYDKLIPIPFDLDVDLSDFDSPVKERRKAAKKKLKKRGRGPFFRANI